MLLLLTMTQFINLLFYTQLFPLNWRCICHHIYFQTLTKFTRTRHFSHRNVVFLRVIQFRLIKPSETHLNHVVPSVPLPLQFFHTTNTFQLKWTSCCLFFFFFFQCIVGILSCTLLFFSLILKHPLISIFLYYFPYFFNFLFSSWAKFQCQFFAFSFSTFISWDNYWSRAIMCRPSLASLLHCLVSFSCFVFFIALIKFTHSLCYLITTWKLWRIQ